MDRSKKNPSEDQREAFLDGLLDPSDRDAWAEKLTRDPSLRREVELQRSIDTALKRLFPLKERDAASIAALLDQSRVGPAQGSPVVRGQENAKADDLVVGRNHHGCRGSLVRRPVAVGLLSTGGTFFPAASGGSAVPPGVDTGFQPYYECREADRFAATFRTRQGQALRLLPLPEGKRMLGLSYPGGLSRNTTAMLGRVGEIPVMVFVDRLEHDTPMALPNDDPDIHLYRTEKHGLVFYEVSPLPQRS